MKKHLIIDGKTPDHLKTTYIHTYKEVVGLKGKSEVENAIEKRMSIRQGVGALARTLQRRYPLIPHTSLRLTTATVGK